MQGGRSVTVDLIGSCFTEDIHPMPLLPAHVNSFLQGSFDARILACEGLRKGGELTIWWSVFLSLNRAAKLADRSLHPLERLQQRSTFAC